MIGSCRACWGHRVMSLFWLGIHRCHRLIKCLNEGEHSVIIDFRCLLCFLRLLLYKNLVKFIRFALPAGHVWFVCWLFFCYFYIIITSMASWRHGWFCTFYLNRSASRWCWLTEGNSLWAERRILLARKCSLWMYLYSQYWTDGGRSDTVSAKGVFRFHCFSEFQSTMQWQAWTALFRQSNKLIHRQQPTPTTQWWSNRCQSKDLVWEQKGNSISMSMTEVCSTEGVTL